MTFIALRKENFMENKNYTIKDIARLAGVSAGTVDRVLHNRGDVSTASREKVQKVLDEIDYQPNVYAIGLAAKKPYRIVCVIPGFVEFDYWHSVCQGIRRAAAEMRAFNVNVECFYYVHADRLSYEEACNKVCSEQQVDAVLIAPNFEEETLRLTGALDEKSIPYVFIDFNMEPAHPLCYIGQDSRTSGYIAAKLLMDNYREGQEVALFLNNQKDNPAEVQMRRRMEGFRTYLDENHRNIRIYDVVLQKQDENTNRRLLDSFFHEHPHVRLGIVFNSRAYQVATYLSGSRYKLEKLVGYDLLQANVTFLESGVISYLIGQRPGLQGYCGIKMLCDHIVFKKPVEPMKYMPIDVLMKENIRFYFEFE